MAFNKVGFLCGGSGGNPTGIGNYVQALGQAGIPPVVMCNDGTVGISDAINVAEAVMVFRVVQDGSEQFSVPDYSLSPIQAAEKHWNLIKPFFPQSVMDNRDRIFIQPINEVDKGRSDWLGFFGVEIAKVANNEGYKVAMFGWSSGEPEPEHWRTPGVLAYLGYCASNPDMACVAVHEYSFGMLPMEMVYPFHVGRFQALFLACEERGIPRPKVLVTEFGWSYNDIPELDQCLADIDFAAELYAQYPEVLGAGIWYLGPGFNNIANQVNSLINPVKDYTLNTVFPDPVPVDEVPYIVVVNLLPQDATKPEKAGVLDLVHESKQTILQSADDAARLVAPGKPGSKVRVWGKERWTGGDIVQWLLDRGVSVIEELPLPGQFKFMAYPVPGQPFLITGGGHWNAPRTWYPITTNQFHEGLDVVAPMGSNVVSVADGVIDGLRIDPGSGYGTYVRIRHNERYLTWYAHLQDYVVQLGQSVVAGQLIGHADSTGSSTGSHLHLTLVDLVNGLSGYIVDKVVDPTPYMAGI